MADRKLKLLIIGERFFPEEFLINEVVDFLLLNNIECEIITHQPSYPMGKIYNNYKNKLYSLDKYKSSKIHRILFLPGYNKSVFIKILNYLWFAIIGMIIVLIKSIKYDKILIYQTGPLTQSLIGVAAKFKSKKPLYIWTWDLWPDSVFAYGIKENFINKSIVNSFVKFIYSNVDQVWVSSPGFVDTINQYFKTKRIHLIPNWVQVKNDNTYLNAHSSLPQGFNITFTGNIGKVQNLENVIKGFSKAVKFDNSIYLNIIGEGSALIELIQLTNSMQVPNIKFWGKFPYEAMDDFYNQSDVLLISLKADSVWSKYIPSKFQTYLKAGKPILGVINGTVKNFIIDNEIGDCANPDDINEIASTILKMKKKPLISLELKEKCNEILINNFNRDYILKNILTQLNN